MLPPSELSKNQIDRLGDRLRKGGINEANLRLLDSYRRSFSDGYESVVSQLRDRLGLEPTGRPAKSTTSIIDKLQRESIRLSQMQDIAGCRLTVSDIIVQDEVVAQAKRLLNKITIVDRREHPSHGYRAVHVVVDQSGKLIEVQIRTTLQHFWAELSEKLSDVVDGAIKYGGGDQEVSSFLAKMSEGLREIETSESHLVQLLSSLQLQNKWPNDINEQFRIMDMIDHQRQLERQFFGEQGDQLLEVLRRAKGRKDALSN